MTHTIKTILDDELKKIREAGLYKEERVILGPQGAKIRVPKGEVLNFCANNYLGLSSHPEIVAAAHRALDTHGYGLSSVRFICGTQEIHKDLERMVSGFFGTDDAILYTSCFDANGGLFETILGERKSLPEEKIRRILGVDMRNPSRIAEDRDRPPHAGKNGLAGRRQFGSEVIPIQFRSIYLLARHIVCVSATSLENASRPGRRPHPANRTRCHIVLPPVYLTARVQVVLDVMISPLMLSTTIGQSYQVKVGLPNFAELRASHSPLYTRSAAARDSHR